MPIAVGIDLGSTQSAVAVYMNEEIAVIPQDDGKSFMPSVVSFTPNGILVGHLAEEQVVMNPESTILGSKRIIGRRFDDPQLQQFLKRVAYDVENVDGNPKIKVTYKGEERLYEAERIAAMILKKLKVSAEIILGHQVVSAVITVPAFFNDSQRQATKDAGSLAGLNVLQVLNETTAAAIAYGLNDDSKEEKYVLIYDIGGGMFDASVLRIRPGNVFETQSTVGDTNLGSYEIDFKLVDYCAGMFYEKHKKDIKRDRLALRRLRLACCRAKDILSSKNEAVITVDALMEGIDFRTNISRSKFEELCEDIFNRIIEILHQTVIDSGITKKDIDDVVLVGGSSQIPKIRQLVRNYFDGKYINKSLNPHIAVIYGAAVRAAFLAGYKGGKLKNMLCVDLMPLSIGIETSGSIMTIVIEKGSFIPTTATYTITTDTDNQPGVAIRVFEGERALTCNNHFLGTLELLGLPPLPRGVPRVEVTFEIDSSGILTVKAEETSDMRYDAITINLNKGRLSKEEIDRLLKEAEEFEEEDKIERERSRYRNALENYFHRICNAAFTDSRSKLSNREKLEINKICNEIRDWLEEHPSANVQDIMEKRKNTIKRLQPYANRLDLSVVSKEGVGYVKGCDNSHQNVKKNDSSKS